MENSMWRDEVVEWIYISWEHPITGDLPGNIFQWRTVFRRLGISRWRVFACSDLPTPFLRNRTLYLPRTRCADILLRYLAHEAAEAAMDAEHVPPFVYVSSRDEREEIACRVEEEVYLFFQSTIVPDQDS